MASNSKREGILRHLERALRGLSWVRTVVREQPGAPEDLEKYGQTQFPVVAVLGKLPTPRKERQAGRGKEFVSSLDALLVVYALESKAPDELVSSMADDLWTALFADRSCGGLALDLTVLPEFEKQAYSPYLAFSLIARVTYAHDHTGI
jgi:hypothetical protein